MNRPFAAITLFFGTALALLGCGSSATTIASARALTEQTQVTVEGFADGAGEIQVFLHGSAGFDATKNAAYTQGSTLTVTEFAGRYDAEFEVDPRSVSDVGP